MENENRELDELIKNLGERILQDEKKAGILNPIRIRQIAFSYAVLKQLSDSSEVKVTVPLHEPFKSMGCICAEGESLEFLDSKRLADAISVASNVEIYPLTNGRVRLVLTFHGLTTAVK